MSKRNNVWVATGNHSIPFRLLEDAHLLNIIRKLSWWEDLVEKLPALRKEAKRRGLKAS